MAKPLAPLLQEFKIVPHDETIFEMAFTHSSANGALGHNAFDYERLEFLGDSLIGLVVSELVYIEHPELNQGGLSKLKAQFIKTQSESSYARRFHFEDYIVVGKSFQGKVGDNPSILEDVFESFIGATYLDQGREFAYSLTRSFFEEDVKKAKLNLLEDPKSMLQEAIQSESKESVSYKILSEEGPSNDKLFISGVYFDNQELGEGQGHSKKEAEFAAARDALAKLAKGTK
jgi:ribonuclease-3